MTLILAGVAAARGPSGARCEDRGMPTRGLFAVNMGPASHPEGAVRLARAAEAAGFDSLWVGEHVVVPDPQVPPSPMAPEDRMLDPVVSLTFLAGCTERVRLATG